MYSSIDVLLDLLGDSYLSDKGILEKESKLDQKKLVGQMFYFGGVVLRINSKDRVFRRINLGVFFFV